MNIKNNSLILLFLLASIWAQSLYAIPDFAKKNNMNCTSCHTVWPQLNSVGRRFKEMGYRFDAIQKRIKESKSNAWNKDFPISALLKSRPYDKKDSGDEKLRIIHEAEIIIGGPIADKFSGFFELEAEDEDTNSRGFEVGIPHARLSYHHSPLLNLGMAWGSFSAYDPYESYNTDRRLTRGRNSVVDNVYGGADNNGKLWDSRQAVSIYGRVNNKLFYSLGIGGVADDSEGVNANSLYSRLVYDIKPNISIGLLAIDGTCKSSASNCVTDRDYSRVGADIQADIKGLRLNAVWMQGKDRNSSNTNDDKNNAWYVQGYYAFKKNGTPTYVPLVRVDQYETTNDTKEYTEITMSLGYVFRKNVKGFIEYWDQTDVPTGEKKDNRITVQLEVAF